MRIRKPIEEAVGWATTSVGLSKARHRGLPKIDWQFTLAMAAYNLVRLPKLLKARRDSRTPSGAFQKAKNSRSNDGIRPKRKHMIIPHQRQRPDQPAAISAAC